MTRKYQYLTDIESQFPGVSPADMAAHKMTMRGYTVWGWLVKSNLSMPVAGLLIFGVIVFMLIDSGFAERAFQQVMRPQPVDFPAVEPQRPASVTEAQPQALPTSAVYYVPLTNPFTMQVGTLAQFMTVDGLRCVLVTESPDQVIGDFFREVFTSCEQ